MKQVVAGGVNQTARSPPAWGAWIETLAWLNAFAPAGVAPRVGGVD